MKLQMDEIRDKLLQKDKLIVLLLGGILLFVILLPTGKKDKNTIGKKESIVEQQQGSDMEQQNNENEIWKDEEEYRKNLEKQLKDILSQMAGVGKVEVMITLRNSQELIVEKDESMNRKSTSEDDGNGGQREINQAESAKTTIYNGEKKTGAPFVVKTVYPSVEGVLVVAEGADSGKINSNITDIAKALFGIEAHKVKVVKRKAAD